MAAKTLNSIKEMIVVYYQIEASLALTSDVETAEQLIWKNG